jgi:hypothetical protein
MAMVGEPYRRNQWALAETNLRLFQLLAQQR